jgi:hypothetical protein
MSNTYFKIEKAVYTNSYSLGLTAFVGNKESGNVQLTIQTRSSIHGQSGIAYITLNDEEIDKLIFGLLERKLKLVTATGDEQSKLCPDNNDK